MLSSTQQNKVETGHSEKLPVRHKPCPLSPGAQPELAARAKALIALGAHSRTRGN